ncbi:MAG: TIGR01777 family protein [Bdellovibrio sp.]|nr:TIGR01777 family protein [Bdellovibrio sp.]
MKILMTGGTGFIGTKLGELFNQAGHQIVIVTRQKKSAQQITPYPAEFIECDLQSTALKKSDFNGVDAIVNLIGETIDGRWTKEKKKKILDSRILSAENLLKNCPLDLKTLVSTSAQGFYGERKDDVVTESSDAGEGFLAEVCEAWEAPFIQWQEKAKTRLVILRLGMVLSHRGGALQKLIALFQKNLGAALGSGKQWISFIALNDLCEIYNAALTNPGYQGIINAVTPNPVRNEEFTAKFCKELGVIQLPKVPGFVLKILLGEMAALVLTSTRVQPEKLIKLGFKFKFPTISEVFALELAEFKDGKRY